MFVLVWLFLEFNFVFLPSCFWIFFWCTVYECICLFSSLSINIPQILTPQVFAFMIQSRKSYSVSVQYCHADDLEPTATSYQSTEKLLVLNLVSLDSVGLLHVLQDMSVIWKCKLWHGEKPRLIEGLLDVIRPFIQFLFSLWWTPQGLTVFNVVEGESFPFHSKESRGLWGWVLSVGCRIDVWDLSTT